MVLGGLIGGIGGLFVVLEGGRCCVVVLCSLNVFGCVNGLLRSFVFLFDCDCMVCGIVWWNYLWNWGIVWWY